MSDRPPQCIMCKLADWKRTSNGRLHPSGDGKCQWQMPQIDLPISMYFIGFRDGVQSPTGGFINRSDPWKECPQFQLQEEKS